MYAGSAYPIPLASCCATIYAKKKKWFKTKDLNAIKKKNDVESWKTGNFATYY